MIGKKPPKLKAELDRPHINMFRTAVHSEAFTKKLAFTTAEGGAHLLEQLARDVIDKTKVRKIFKRRVGSNVKSSEDFSGVYHHMVFMESWDKNNRACFVSFSLISK